MTRLISQYEDGIELVISNNDEMALGAREAIEAQNMDIPCIGIDGITDAVAAVDDKDVQILDVRDDDTYKAGHLKGSFQCGLKEVESADAQTAMYKLATEKMDSSKKVYLLCYSGNKCAKTGMLYLKDAWL